MLDREDECVMVLRNLLTSLAYQWHHIVGDRDHMSPVQQHHIAQLFGGGGVLIIIIIIIIIINN